VVSKSVGLPDVLRLGDDFELDVRAYELRSAGIPLKLKPIPMELLLFLLERRGELVTRGQIVERIWGKGVFLDTDNSINGAISRVRQVLRDDPENPRFVQTVTGKGYRFIAPVEEMARVGSEETAPPPTATADNLSGKKISHYRVLRLLGGGGMGVVYEAEDLKLGRRVALKFLPGEMAADPGAFARLQQEARAASALDHPNICSIYELGEHEGQPFIVMQLLEGKTLREWIESASDRSMAKRLPQLLDLSIQVAEGLEAAQQKGIVHRDIKPANIFVTNRGQAKILDFGVAKFLEASEPPGGPAGSEVHEARAVVSPDPRTTRTGASVGTPSYLSPEQIRGEKLDARTDLFSLGLVLYEMVTGQQAFPGGSVTIIRDAVLHHQPVPAHGVNTDIPAELERVIHRALEKDRDRRYQSARELRGDLEGLRARVSQAPPPRRHAWPWVAAGVAMVALAMVAFNLGGLKERWFHSAPVAQPEFKARPSVAVLGFKNLSGKTEGAWISTALSEMVGADLAAGQQLRVVPSEDVVRMELDLSLPAADTYNSETLGKIRNHLSTDLVVLGSYLALGKESGGKVRIDLQLQDTKTGETIAVISQDGMETDLADLVSRGGAALRRNLGLADVSVNDVRQVRSSIPANLGAARLYSEGLAKLHSFDAMGASALLQKAIAADPNHALSHSALAESWHILGYVGKAQAEAKKAFDLSGNLSREDRLLVEGRYREFTPDFPAAIEIYRTLRNFFPDNLDYALRLASAQSNSDAAKDAVQTVARMRSMPAPQNQDARIDLAEAKAAENLGDFGLMQRASAAAAAKAQAQGSRLVEAQAKEQEGWALGHLGDFDKTMAAYRQAQELSSAEGNLNLTATVYYGIAGALYDKGDYAGARKYYEDSERVFRQIGSLQNAAYATGSLGNVYFSEGNLEQAKHYYEAALQVHQELGDASALGGDLGNIANTLILLGDLVEATRMQEQSLAAYRRVGNKLGEGSTLNGLGSVLTYRGLLDDAKKAQEEALAVAQESGYERDRGFALEGLATITQYQGRLDEARATAQQVLDLRKKSDEQSLVAVSQLQIAGILFDQGKFAEAESLARSSAVVCDQQKMADSGAESQALLARVLLAQSKIKDAQVAAERAAVLAKQTSNLPSVFEAALAGAIVKAELGQAAEAAASLESVRSKAAHYGYAPYELEARLQLGMLELKSGKTAAGRQRLQQLQRDAQAKRFSLVARKAAAALRTTQS